MLFLVKRDSSTSLICAGLLALAAWGAHVGLSITWAPPTSVVNLVSDGLFGAALILASDAVLHTMLSTIAPRRYPPAFTALARVFEDQSLFDGLAGGVCAGAEELLFRGVLVSGGIHVIGFQPITAAALAALAFGLAHMMLNRHLWAFSIWAAWEGMLLGLLYLASGSLGAVVLAHMLHDVAGFWYFRRSLLRQASAGA
jgi:membrane protease YdiL (CAAX protease family)